MGAQKFSTITSALQTLYMANLVPQINRSAVTLGLLPKRTSPGKDISWAVATGTGKAGAKADGADESSYRSDDKRGASLDYVIYTDPFQTSGFAKAAAANSGGPSPLSSLDLSDMMESTQRMAHGLNDAIFNGVGSTEMLGMTTSGGPVDDAGTYATIARGSVSQWQSTVDGNSSVNRPLSTDLMRSMRTSIYEASGLRPNLIVTSPAQFENYGQLLDDKRRYVEQIQLDSRTIRLDAGFTALSFDGIPVVMDADCPDGEMYFLNTNFLYLDVLPPVTDGVTWSQLAVSGTAEEQFNSVGTGLSLKVNKLSNAGDYTRYQSVVYCQLVNLRPNSCGLIEDLGT